MAGISAAERMLFLLWCAYFAGLSSARSVQRPSRKAAEDDMRVGRVLTPNDLRCDLPGCTYDLLLYCLSNGDILIGSCSLKITLCRDDNSLQLAKTWDPCFLATYSLITVKVHDRGLSETPRPEAKEAEGETEVKGEGVQGPRSQSVGNDAMNSANLQLEQELLTDPEVKVDGGTEVKAHGNNGDRA